MGIFLYSSLIPPSLPSWYFFGRTDPPSFLICGPISGISSPRRLARHARIRGLSLILLPSAFTPWTPISPNPYPGAKYLASLRFSAGSSVCLIACKILSCAAPGIWSVTVFTIAS